MRIILLLIIGFFLLSCNPNSEEGAAGINDSLSDINSRLTKKLAEKDSLISYFMLGFNEIQHNLIAIRDKQLEVTKSVAAAKGKASKENILNNIKIIDILMEKNKKTIGMLKNKLVSSGQDPKSAEYESFISNLDQMIDERDNEISNLLDNLESMNSEMGALIGKYNDASHDAAVKTKKLNTAWYTAGTEQELANKGVITRQGGFIGIGKTQKLSSQFRKENFSEVDITQLKSIKLEARKIKLITTHHEDSYTITSDGGGSAVFIHHPEKFWSASKYLVVLIEKK